MSSSSDALKHETKEKSVESETKKESFYEEPSDENYYDYAYDSNDECCGGIFDDDNEDAMFMMVDYEDSIAKRDGASSEMTASDTEDNIKLKKDPEHFPFRELEEAHVHTRLSQFVAALSSVHSLPPFSIRALLLHYHWSVQMIRERLSNATNTTVSANQRFTLLREANLIASFASASNQQQSDQSAQSALSAAFSSNQQQPPQHSQPIASGAPPLPPKSTNHSATSQSSSHRHGGNKTSSSSSSAALFRKSSSSSVSSNPIPMSVPTLPQPVTPSFSIPQECPVCLEEFCDSDALDGSVDAAETMRQRCYWLECGHGFCGACWERHIDTKLGDATSTAAFSLSNNAASLSAFLIQCLSCQQLIPFDQSEDQQHQHQQQKSQPITSSFARPPPFRADQSARYNQLITDQLLLSCPWIRRCACVTAQMKMTTTTKTTTPGLADHQKRPTRRLFILQARCPLLKLEQFLADSSSFPGASSASAASVGDGVIPSNRSAKVVCSLCATPFCFNCFSSSSSTSSSITSSSPSSSSSTTTTAASITSAASVSATSALTSSSLLSTNQQTIQSNQSDQSNKSAAVIGAEPHAPASCSVMRQWIAQCAQDQQTALYLASHTKDCPKCRVSIEKNGGCNHMVCGCCKAEFCWLCMQPWDTHGVEFYECSRYKEAAIAAKKTSAAGSAAGEPLIGLVVSSELDRQARKKMYNKYLFYHQRWENHERSLRLEQNHRDQIRRIIDKNVMKRNGTWIDWQHLLTAADTLRKCRHTLKFTYPTAFFMPSGPRKTLFEYQQCRLEAEVENLAWQIQYAEIHERAAMENKMDVCEKHRVTMLQEFLEI